MNYPKLRVLDTQRQMVDTFKGYNHNLRIGEGEFYEMENMTSDYYPILAPRGKRKSFIHTNNASDIIAKDGVCYVEGDDFVMKRPLWEMRIPLLLNNRPKWLVPMGAYVIIMPDKKYINTTDMGDWGDVEQSFSSVSLGRYERDVTFQLCTITGEAYEDATVSTTAPEDPADNALWIDTSSTPHALKKYSKTSEMWVAIATTYVKISCLGINGGFKQYDGVTISGILSENLQNLNGSHVIQGVGDGYIIVSGILDEVTTQTAEAGAVTVERKMPDMDFVIESENRLWGCKYGTNANGEMVNEIYASKLGDFKNWNCFMGLSTDSYVASCGSDGPFTGAITHMGHPLFFKEHCVHKVYGNYPANFQIQTTACRGVLEGCQKSLAIVNETLFYKSRGGVCAYDGSFPTEVSYALGNEQYSDAVAGGQNNKYYISMKDAAGNYHLFVYDAAKGMWHREDDLRADGFCSYQGELYALDHETKNIIAMTGVCWPGTKGEDQVKWMVQTGLIGTDMPDMKYISNLVVRLSPSKGAVVRFWVQYDSMGGWEHIHTVTCRNLRSLAIPLKPRRCDHLRLKIEGEGDVRIHSITKTIEQGSDIS